MYQSELTSTWDPSKIPPFSQLKPDRWNLFLRWQFAVLLFSTVFKFVYATASHMLWFLCLLYVMTRLLRGHEELIVTTQNCDHRNVQLILFQTADVSGPQLRRPSLVQFWTPLLRLSILSSHLPGFQLYSGFKEAPIFNTAQKGLEEDLTCHTEQCCTMLAQHFAYSSVGQGESTGCIQKRRTMLAQHVTTNNVGQRLPKTLHPAVLHKIGVTCNIQQCWTTLAQPVTSGSVGQWLSNTLHPKRLNSDCPTGFIQQCWTILAQYFALSSVGQCWTNVLCWLSLEGLVKSLQSALY